MFKEKFNIFLSKFNWFEITYISLGMVAIIVLSILAKSSALTICFSITATLYVALLAKRFKFAIVLGIIQSILYIIQSALYKNWGELILTSVIVLPILIATYVLWNKESDKNELQVRRKKMSLKVWCVSILICLILGVGFYFLLKYLETPNLIIATISVSLNILAHWLMLNKNPAMFMLFLICNVFMLLIWLLPIVNGESANLETIPMLVVISLYLISNSLGIYNWFKKS